MPCYSHACSSPWTVEAPTLPALAMRIVSGEHAPLPEEAAPDLCGLVKTLLERDPAARLSIERVLQLGVVKVLSQYVRTYVLARQGGGCGGSPP